MATFILSIVTALLISSAIGLAGAAESPAACHCGFRDPATSSVYTESLIIYFNETDAIDPEIFEVQDYAHVVEKGWNSVYRQGAKPYNVRIMNDTLFHPKLQVLELQTNPVTSDHLVNGGGLRTVRQDILNGTFQAALKPAQPRTGGTATSLMLSYNASQGLEMDVMNMKEPEDARVSYLVNGEWPSEDTVTNFTILEAAGQHPWDQFTNVRMDWNSTNVTFWIEGNQTRSLSKKDRTLPLAGQPLFLKSWSTGDEYWMEGPPSVYNSSSHVLYLRAFFNSSATTVHQRQEFDQRCAGAQYCSTADMELRGSTPYTIESTRKWKDPPNDIGIRKTAGIVAACCSSFGVFALINAFFRRLPWDRVPLTRRLRKTAASSLSRSPSAASIFQRAGSGRSSFDSDPRKSPFASSVFSNSTAATIQTPLPAYGSMTPRSGYQTPVPGYETPPVPALPVWSVRQGVRTSVTTENRESYVADTVTSVSSNEKPRSLSNVPGTCTAQEDPFSDDKAVDKTPNQDSIGLAVVPEQTEPATPAATEKEKQSTVFVTPLPPETLTAASAAEPVKPAPTKRIDYLAGLVAVACLGVTLHHFCQTFWPWIIEGYGPGAHYPKAERWIKIFVGAYALTQLWIGPFFLTATRFLSTNYLKNGNLEDIAKKELRRAPRLFVPIIMVSLLEFFFISLGLTASLEWLPSVSWATWPYVSQQPNFGVYLNNIIELAYLMPNAIPEVVTHYCIGVLWTVPVQLQFTYVVLTAAVLIRDIKSPWKRFGFYAIMILTGWYAKSWSACHWCGLVLSDLEATYKWRTYLQKHPVAMYAVLSGAFLCAAGTPLVAVFGQDWSFDTFENSLHPDFSSGKAIMTEGAVYPGYNEPTLTILLFSIGVQILVELSTAVQWVLSTKVILLLHPHIMTIYLTHGFVMWTWGAWIAVTIHKAGLPYWANLLITLVTTYAFIFLLASVLTPLMEFPTQAAMRNLDRWTKEASVRKRKTTAPFTKGLVLDRHASSSNVGGA